MTVETILAYVGIALGVIGLIASYYFYRKSIRIKEPVYSIRSNNLISGSISTLENLNISYKDTKVENLTVSKLLFYNRGEETITRQDIETMYPLSISAESCRILDASILQVNYPSNNIAIHYEKDKGFIYVDLDYLDKNQGVVIQVIHTGTKSEHLDFFGTVKGVQKLSRVSSEQLQVVSSKRVSEN